MDISDSRHSHDCDFAAFFAAAHRLSCPARIAALPASDIVRFFFTVTDFGERRGLRFVVVGMDPLMSAFACSRRAISRSIAAMRDAVFMVRMLTRLQPWHRPTGDAFFGLNLSARAASVYVDMTRMHLISVPSYLYPRSSGRERGFFVRLEASYRKSRF